MMPYVLIKKGKGVLAVKNMCKATVRQKVHHCLNHQEMRNQEVEHFACFQAQFNAHFKTSLSNCRQEGHGHLLIYNAIKYYFTACVLQAPAMTTSLNEKPDEQQESQIYGTMYQHEVLPSADNNSRRTQETYVQSARHMGNIMCAHCKAGIPLFPTSVQGAYLSSSSMLHGYIYNQICTGLTPSKYLLVGHGSIACCVTQASIALGVILQQTHDSHYD
eukprot:scaffold170996_cov20-Tisochrysis_lutea.AAC.1